MKPALLLTACALSLSSCDQAKEIASKAMVAVEEVKADFSESSDSAASASPSSAILQSLVDQNAEGYLFRKDLPFPSALKVRVVEAVEFNGRYFQSSLIETGAASINGEFRTERELENRGGIISASFQDLWLSPLGVENPEKARKSLRSGAKMVFGWKDGKWALSGKPDFSAMAMLGGQDIGQGLMREGIMPRPFWFGKNRLKIGDEVVLSGAHLGMLGMFHGEGEMRLKFESVESVKSHPCGVFTISGILDQADVGLPGDSGQKGQLTIESGKIWFSLVHPVVLKEEIGAVITSKTGEGKKLSSHTQGRAMTRIEREWSIPSPSGS